MTLEPLTEEERRLYNAAYVLAFANACSAESSEADKVAAAELAAKVATEALITHRMQATR